MAKDKNKNKNDVIERKKLEIEEELNTIQHELDDSIQQVRSDVTTKLDPIRIIRKYPWPFVGASALLGFLLAGLGGNRSRSDRETKAEEIQRSQSQDSNKVFRPILFNELKKLAARRAVSFATDYLDDILRSRRYERTMSARNGKRREREKVK